MTQRIAVVETEPYLKDADYAGMGDEDRAAVVDEVSLRPNGGNNLGGGLYKVRVARPGMGKSGGWRVLAGFVGRHLPVFLLAVFAKGDRSNLTRKEVEMLKQAIAEEIRDYGQKSQER